MSAAVLTIWLCLTANPDCPIEQSTVSPIAHNTNGMGDCEAIAQVVTTVLPAPKGKVVRHFLCTPKDED